MTTEEEKVLDIMDEDETEKDYSLDRVPLEDRTKS